MKLRDLVVAITLFSSLGWADEVQNIDYDVTLRIAGFIVCEKCNREEEVVVIVSRKGDDGSLETILSRSILKINQSIMLKENYSWGYRVGAEEKTPTTMIYISFEIKGCKKEMVQYDLQGIPFIDGEFFIDIGELKTCI